MLAESRATGILCRAVRTGDGTHISGRGSAVIASGRHAVIAPSRIPTAMPPSVVIFTIATVMIPTTMVSTLTAPSVVTAQQHVKETHICSPFKQ